MSWWFAAVAVATVGFFVLGVITAFVVGHLLHRRDPPRAPVHEPEHGDERRRAGPL